MSTETTKMAVSLYTEATPNPNTLKFVANRMLYPSGSIEIKSLAEANEVPLAAALFAAFPFVDNVFIAKNFVTVTKNVSDEWFEINLPVKDLIKTWLEDGKDVFSADFKAKAEKEASEPKLDVEIEEGDIEGKIKAILDKYVQPGVQQDGGNIAFVSFEDGVLNLEMQGSCSGCPSASMTLKNGVETLVKRFVPEVKEVVATEE